MASLTTNTVSVASGLLDLDASLVAAASGGDTADVGSGKFLIVKNADASPHTVTIATTGTRSGLALADGTYVVAAGDSAVIALAEVFRGSNGRASITYDAITSVSVGVFEIGS